MAFKVYIVTSGYIDNYAVGRDTYREHGTFSSRELAELYIGARSGFDIKECTVSDRSPTKVLDLVALDWDGEVVMHNSRRVWDHEHPDQYLDVAAKPLPYYMDPERLGNIVQVWGETTRGYDVLVSAARTLLSEQKAKRTAVLANRTSRNDV